MHGDSLGIRLHVPEWLMLPNSGNECTHTLCTYTVVPYLFTTHCDTHLVLHVQGFCNHATEQQLHSCMYLNFASKRISSSFQTLHKVSLPSHITATLQTLSSSTVSLRLSTVEWVRESRASHTLVRCFLGRAWKNSSRSNGDSFERWGRHREIKDGWLC